MSTDLTRFRVVRRPKGTGGMFSHIVIDEQGRPHLPLSLFYHQLQCLYPEGTARSYVSMLLPYFTYLAADSWRKSRGDLWFSEPDAVRESVRDYLVEWLHCKVQPKYTYALVRLSAKSPSTIRVFLAALKQFYSIMIQKQLYLHTHPLLDAPTALLREVDQVKRKMPPVSGVEEPVTHRISENFFRLPENNWEVTPVDDPTLGQTLLSGCKKVGMTLRDQIVVRLALETGARIREILTLTVGDWRARGCKQEANTWSKGSFGRRVKALRFSDITARMLRQYLNTDRARLDRDARRLDQLEDTDPLFLSQRCRPYDYEAFKVHWYRLCRNLGLELNIHALRHWYTTMSMRFIVETAKSSAEITKRKEELVRYMAWRHPETLATYENYFKRLGHFQIQDQVHQALASDVKRYLQQKSPQMPRRQKEVAEATPPVGTAANGWDKLLALGGR